IYACWQYVQQKSQQLLNTQGLYQYNDQIKVVSEAVNNNPKLVKLIAEQWQCVMVDEFQDTDAQQLAIFEKCFMDAQHDVIFVGDPKQAIYSFRGADVFVYQQAKEKIKQQFNLATNWRSSAKMVQASNQLFDFNDSFIMQWLKFYPSKPKPTSNTELIDTSDATLLSLDHASVDKRLQHMATEIKRLLQFAKIEQNNTQQTLANQDIAILVNKNSEAIKTYDYLLSQNIAVSLFSDAGVFATEMAQCLYFFLRAINYPSTAYIFTSYQSLFFQKSLNQLHALSIQTEIAQFIDFQIALQKGSIAKNLTAILQKNDVFARLLARIDGERHYTDLMQLLELIQNQADLGKNSEQIEQWLALEIKHNRKPDEEDSYKRRLESDGEKIAIMTIHKSKGLEFPIIFIPFSDSIKDTHKIPNQNKNLKSIVSIHDEQYQGVISWQHSEQAEAQFLLETAAENRRTLYVALTRAKFRTYLGYDSQDKNAKSITIHRLLENYGTIQAALNQVNTNSKPNTNIEQQEKLICQKFTGHIPTPISIYSFSALTKIQPHVQQDFINDDEELDYTNYFHFPKGSLSGSMQHAIFENINFDSSIQALNKNVSQQLQKYNFSELWQNCLSQQIHKILNTSLWQNGVQLAQLKQYTVEMEFMLPITPNSHKQISTWLSQHRKQATEFSQEQLSGYLTGFIDLVFQHQGKFYVLDYKTNHLGNNFSDYSDNKLQQAIYEHFYDWQYLLYTTALVKYLKTINANFSYQNQFGGVVYLFTRGINGKTAQGIYFKKPEQQIINQMLEYFNGK
ncbi:MAG TPA: hypothetical protein ENJ44_00095, partial [Oceanospirillales bacterium]|nr:hypothetical protein [Oceanospirillales bacterium]